jgi:hypothetical protein
MAEGYAESFEQVAHAGRSAWYLTANEDAGGGTFQVIEALKDRIDIVVRAPPFHSRSIAILADRVAKARAPDASVPADAVFTAEELDEAEAEIRAVPVPPGVLETLGFLAGSSSSAGAPPITSSSATKTPSTSRARRWPSSATKIAPSIRPSTSARRPRTGSPPGVSSHPALREGARLFRGKPAVGVDDIRQVLPFCLFDKLHKNPQSPFFQKAEHRVLLLDQRSWIQRLFDQALTQHAAFGPVREMVRELRVEAESPAASAASAADLKRRIAKVQRTIDEVIRKADFSGLVYDDLVLLKSIHDGYVRRLDAIRRIEGGAESS